MKNKTIKEIKQLLAAGDINKEFLKVLESDQRKGIQQLIATYKKGQQKKKALAQRFQEMSCYELENYKQGKKYIAGIDEAGRGPLAGPVVSAAVILPKDFHLPGLTDSKQLNESQRNIFYKKIIDEAVSYHVAIIDNETIDRINILEATKLAMHTAVNALEREPDHVLIDAVALDQLTQTSEVIFKGDQKSITIAAASVLAKVTRDRLMSDIHAKYPMYDFHLNMGYGTKKHLEMIKKHGITPYHRKSFSPVHQAIK